MKNRSLQAIFASALLASFVLAGLPVHAFGQAAAQTAAVADYKSGLAAIEAKTDARRQELGIPGMSLVIVKDGKVIYAKGLGFKDFENKVLVTADTEFAIGSSTKAFTALSVLMTADEGKISLDASPKTVLPYFKMADPDTDKNMTIRDLMTHSSGLNRTDIAMITGKLTRKELIQVAGEAKPVAKLHEKFGYQNLMFAAAGEVVTVAQKQSWETFIPERVFKPLGMTNTTMAIREMEKTKDFSFGYSYNFDTKETTKLPFRDIDQVAPAGSINSSANDMSKWLQFVLAGGTVNGKRLVSEKSFEEWLKPQQKISPDGKFSYALGWFIQDWNGMKVVQHGGNIDGFNALVAMIPEKNLGFVMLTNVSGSSLGGELMPIVWENILGKPEPKTVAGADVAPEKEAGKYRFEAAAMDFDVQWKDAKLVAVVPGQPVYTLEKVSSRRYKLAGAPDGFFITFKDKELFLEQPQGNYTLPRIGAETTAASNPAAAKELIGKYVSEVNGRPVEIKEQDGKVVFLIGEQQPYALAEKEKDKFSMSPLPDTYWINVKRTADNKLEKIVVTQPEGEFAFKPASQAAKFAMTADEVLTKALEASGGEANWKKLTSRVSTVEMDMEQQGVKATATVWNKAPYKTATAMTMTAIGKKIATGWEFFDGTTGEDLYSFAPADKYTGKRLEDAKVSADFYPLFDLAAKYKKIEIVRMAKCGEEECYAISFEPEKATKFTDYFSVKTFLLLKREGSIASSTSSVQTPYTTKLEDYRDVDGVKIPFKMVSNTAGNGDIVTIVKTVKHNVPIDDSTFKPRKL